MAIVPSLRARRMAVRDRRAWCPAMSLEDTGRSVAKPATAGAPVRAESACTCDQPRLGPGPDAVSSAAHRRAACHCGPARTTAEVSNAAGSGASATFDDLRRRWSDLVVAAAHRSTAAASNAALTCFIGPNGRARSRPEPASASAKGSARLALSKARLMRSTPWRLASLARQSLVATAGEG
jgi:hypothetical protein